MRDSIANRKVWHFHSATNRPTSQLVEHLLVNTSQSWLSKLKGSDLIGCHWYEMIRTNRVERTACVHTRQSGSLLYNYLTLFSTKILICLVRDYFFFLFAVCIWSTFLSVLCVVLCFSEMWYWVFLWCLFSSLFVHGAVGLLMLVMLQRHKRGRLITLVLVSVGFLASLSGGVITSKSSYFTVLFFLLILF